MIIGGSGAGKSTFARQISDRIGVPAVHMDTLFWERGWVMADEADFLARVKSAVAEDRWAMDGNYSRTWPDRIARADTIVFLDMPTWLRMWRVITRTLRHYGKSRADLGEDCPERFEMDFLFNWVARYRWRARGKALALIASDGPAAHLTRVHLRSAGQVRRYLDSLSPVEDYVSVK